MSAIIVEKDPLAVVEFRTPGPGERLRSARLAQDLDIAKVAAKLHLTADMVDAIECDDYSELPARVFVRGYIRNYARLVSLPSDSIMSQFDQLWPDDDTTIKVENAPRLAAESHGASRWVGLITWGLLLAGVVLLLVWWQGHLDQIAPLQSQPEAVANPPAEAAAGLSESVEQPVTPVINPQLPVGAGVLPLPDPSTATSNSPASSSPTVAVASPAESSAVAVSVPSAAAPSLLQQDNSRSQAPVVQAEPPSAQPSQALGIPEVKVRFVEACWADIRASEGDFRVFGTRPAGTEVVLQGQPPFKFVLGNASGVRILVDGQSYDMTPHTRNNVARFSLDP